MLNNIMQQAGNTATKLKEGAENIAVKTGFIDANTIKIKPLHTEKTKMLEFIGMEAYDLYRVGQLNEALLSPFFKRLDEINADLAKLESQQKIQRKCQCNALIPVGTMFCANCGTSVATLSQNSTHESNTENPVCACGKINVIGAKFCAGCGANITTPNQYNLTHALNTKKSECVCGALVDGGQFLCMECGRRTNI